MFFNTCLTLSGKTLLAKSLKSFLPQVNVLHVHTWNFLSKYIGDGEKRIKETFEFARKHQPSILILEDLDAMSDARNEGSSDRIRRLKTEMLVQLSSTNNHRDDTLTIIGITNRPKDINKAVLKRFIKCIYFPLPEEFTRKDLLKERFGSFAYELTDSEFDELVTRTEGYTGSDLEVLSRDIAMVPLRDMMNATHFYIRPDGKYHPCLPTKEGSTEMSLLSLKSEECYVRPVTWQDVRNCLSRSKPSVNQEEMQDYMDFVILKGLEDQLNGSANQPMSLMKLAKISIKSPLISNNQMKNIHQLPLPKRLQDYLLTH